MRRGCQRVVKKLGERAHACHQRATYRADDRGKDRNRELARSDESAQPVRHNQADGVHGLAWQPNGEQFAHDAGRRRTAERGFG